MSINEPFLKIRFDGEAIGRGRIPVHHLLRFLDSMNKAFQRTGRLLLGKSESIHRGRQPDNIKSELALDLVMLTHGSPAAVLGFERGRKQLALPGMDVGLEIMEKAIAGLDSVQCSDDPSGDNLPPGCDAGVLWAWRDAGVLFSQGVQEISFSLNHREKPLATRFTPKSHIASVVRWAERLFGFCLHFLSPPLFRRSTGRAEALF